MCESLNNYKFSTLNCNIVDAHVCSQECLCVSQQLYIQHTLTSNAEVPTKNASWGRNCTDFLIPHQMQMCERVYVVQQYYANPGKYEASTKCTHSSHNPGGFRQLSNRREGSRPRCTIFCNFFTQLFSLSSSLTTFSIAQSCSAGCSNVALLCDQQQYWEQQEHFIFAHNRFPTVHCLL